MVQGITPENSGEGASKLKEACIVMVEPQIDEVPKYVPIEDVKNETDVKVEPEEDEDKNLDGMPKIEETPTSIYIKQLLKKTVEVKDGTCVPVFSYGPPNLGDKQCVRRFICHLCERRMVASKTQIERHVGSNYHETFMNFPKGRNKVPYKKRWMKPYFLEYSRRSGNMVNFKIFPGENIEDVTPELADRLVKKPKRANRFVDQVVVGLNQSKHTKLAKKANSIVDKVAVGFNEVKESKLSKILSNDRVYEYNKKRPLLGLDYLLKINNKGNVGKYCTLCKKKIQYEAYRHVVQVSHQIKYIMLHFPRLYKRVTDNLNVEGNIAKKNCIRNIFRVLYRRIEIEHGLKKMCPVSAHAFEKNRALCIKKASMAPHYNENTINISVGDVDVLINKCNRNVSFIEPDPANEGALEDEGDALDNKPGVKIAIDGEQSKWRLYPALKKKRLDELNALWASYGEDGKLHPKNCKSGARQELGLPWRGRTPDLSFPENNNNLRQSNEPKNFERGANSGRSIEKKLQQHENRRPQQEQYPRSQRLRQEQQQQAPPRKRPAPRERLSVISVLRLVSAIEDLLGSLGPKSIQLLSEAIICDKEKQNLLLADNEYYIFFATAKEKLKGQLMAKLIDDSKIRVVNSVIDNLIKIIRLMDKESNSVGRHKKTNDNGPGISGGSHLGNNINMVNGDNDQFNRSRGYGNFRNDNLSNNNDSLRFNNELFQSNGGNYRADLINNKPIRSLFDIGNNYCDGFTNNNPIRSLFDSGNNYRDGFTKNNTNFNSANNYCGSNDTGNYSSSNFGGCNNYRFNNDGGNCPSNNSSSSNYAGNSANNRNSRSNYRENDGNISSATGPYDSGSANDGGKLSRSSYNFASNMNQYQNIRNLSINDFNFNSNQTSKTGRYCVGQGGEILYCSSNSKLNSNTLAFSSALEGGNNSLSGSNRNLSSNFVSGGGAGGQNSGNSRQHN